MTSNIRFGLVLVAAFSGGLAGSWLFSPGSANAQISNSTQVVAGQPITVQANLPTIINVPPQGLIFRGSSGRTLARLDETSSSGSFSGKLTFPQSDSAGKDVPGKKTTIEHSRLTMDSGGDYSMDLTTVAMTLKGKGYPGYPTNVGSASTLTIKSGSAAFNADANTTVVGGNFVSVKSGNTAKMFTSAGVAAPPL